MNTRKLPLSGFSCQLAVFTLLSVSLVFSSVVYSYPSDVIIEYPTGLVTGENDSVITFDSVRNELSADGEWIKVNQDEIDSASVTDGSIEFDDDINTEYVWRPRYVDENWSPYTNGYWTYTNCGWMWVSYYEWGWRPYHYGRWWWSSRYGWVWSPGYIWAPAWVVWMFYDGYCGWYPLSPRVRWRHHHHHHGYYCKHVRFRVRHWNFCHYNNFSNTPITSTVIIDPKDNGEILKRSVFASDLEYANGIVTNKGPELKEIEKSIGKKIVAEDVKKYNTTRKVNELLKRSAEEIQKTETRMNEKQGNNTNNEKQVKNEEKKKTSENTWEENPYLGTPKENNEKKSEEKNNESVNKKEEQSKEQNNSNKRNDNNYKNETPKQEAPKYEAPKQETPKQEAPKQENYEKKDENNNKSNEGLKQDGKKK